VTTRKIRNIQAAKLPKGIPLVSMTHKQRSETFFDICGDANEGMVADAREDKSGPICLISIALKRADGSERLVSAYDEYGDGDHHDMCDELLAEYSPFLHEDESLRIVTYEVDIRLATPFPFPPEEKFKDREWRSRYTLMHDARGVVTLLVTWLVFGNKRNVLTWHVDHGDGCSREYNEFTTKGVRYNKVLARQERLEVVMYDVPMSALREVPHIGGP
jgi:hypothetical protein